MLPRAEANEAFRMRSHLILIAILCGSLLLEAAPQKESRSRDAAFGGFVRAELVNAETHPTLRFPVMHWYSSIWSVTYGWMEISRDTVRYEVQQPNNKRGHSFTSSRQGVTKLKWQGYWLYFQAAGKGRYLVYLPPERWGTIHTGFGMNSAGAENQAFTRGIQDTLQSFERVLAAVAPAPKPAPAVMESKPVPAAPSEPAPPIPPTIVLTQPSVGNSGDTLEVQGPTLTVRGIATDSSSLPMVTINGVPANMKPRSGQVVEFWSDPVALTPGQNAFEIVAANSAKVKSTFHFVAQLPPPPSQPARAATSTPAKPEPAVNPKALSKAEILELLANYVPSARVAALVREKGIKFQATPADLDEIAGAGGAEDLLEAIKEAGKSLK